MVNIKKTKAQLIEIWETYSHSPIPALVLSKQGKIVQYNNAMKKLTGYAHREVPDIEAWMPKMYPDEKYRNHVIEVSRKSRQREIDVVSDEFVITRKSGEKRIIEFYAVEIIKDGKPTDFQIVQGIDITQRKQVDTALRKSEELYRSLFENMLEGYAYCEMLFDHDKPQDFIYFGVNKAFEELTGLKNVVGKKVSEVIPGIKESNPELFKIYGRVALTGKPERFETYIESLGIWLSIAVYCPEKKYFIAVFDNITERKRADEALHDSEERYRSLYDQIPDLYISLNPKGEIIECNVLGAQKIGYSFDELIGRQIRSLLTEESIQKFDKEFPLLLKNGKLLNAQRSIITKNGQICNFILNAEIYYDADGNPLRTREIFRDITEIKRAEIQLRVDKKKLRALALELTISEDREGKRIAEYLHDTISQALVVIKLKLGTLKELKDLVPAAILNKEISELLEQVIESTRSITFDLSSPVLDRLGFEPAVEWLCEKMAEDHGLAIDFISDSSKKDIDDDMKRFLYRSTRELLMNVVKHAHAHRVKVSVLRKKGIICITVDDDGVGFRESVDDKRYLERGFGLFSIRERLDHLGGSMIIESKPDRGTRVSLSWKERRRTKNRSNHEN